MGERTDTVISCILCMIIGLALGYFMHPDLTSTSTDDRVDRVETLLKLTDYKVYNLNSKIPVDDNTTVAELKSYYWSCENCTSYYNTKYFTGKVLRYVCDGTIRNPLK